MAKILLIDCDRTSRQLLEKALALYEHSVIATQTSEEGLKLAATTALDVTIQSQILEPPPRPPTLFS